MDKKNLQPQCVFEQFAKINAIPRPSKHEEKMIEFLKDFGNGLNLETEVDETGNVIIRKPASTGYENRETLILQSHMDMVCDKLVDVDIDFTKDPIQTYVDGEWLRAKGTTLGADDGIGCAMQMAVLADNSLEHGPIECVFTRDEETGLTGAHGMKPGFMKGNLLINLDSEDEGQFFISCAGGMTTKATFSFTPEAAPEGYFFMKLSLKGLHGGHSGDDIDKKKEDVRIAVNMFASDVEDEFHVTEHDIRFNLESTDARQVMPKTTGCNIISALQAVDNGPYSMCQDEALAWMVETSSNVASVMTADGKVEIVASQRSNVSSNLVNMGNTVKAVFQLAGAEVTQGDKYPAWKMNPDSALTGIVTDTYKKLFGKEPKVIGIHAGLECGLFSEKYPGLDMVSMGPTLRGVHSPDERLLIPTVQMVWDHLLEIMKNIPTRK